MKIEAKKIRIEFNNSSEDYWEASCESGLELDEVIRMVTRAWEEHGASAGPLIKDEKIRKAVRAWADANEIVKAFVVMNEHMNWTIHGDDIDRNRFRIEFFDRVVSENDETKNYTIDELCGEEEAPEPIEPTFVDIDERIKEKEEE